MAKKKVALMGSNLPRYDTGFVNPTGFFIDLFKAEIPIIANITNLDKLPESGFTLVVMPLKIAGICTCPARVIAIINYRRRSATAKHYLLGAETIANDLLRIYS